MRDVRQIDTRFPTAISGPFAYLVEFAFGLQVIDIRNPDAPRLISRIDTPSEALNVAAQDSLIYVTDLIFGLQVIRGPQFDVDANGDDIPDDFRDTDGDGIIDFFDAFPLDPSEYQEYRPRSYWGYG